MYGKWLFSTFGIFDGLRLRWPLIVITALMVSICVKNINGNSMANNVKGLSTLFQLNSKRRCTLSDYCKRFKTSMRG